MKTLETFRINLSLTGVAWVYREWGPPPYWTKVYECDMQCVFCELLQAPHYTKAKATVEVDGPDEYITTLMFYDAHTKSNKILDTIVD